MGKKKRRFTGQSEKGNILAGQAGVAPQKGPTEFLRESEAFRFLSGTELQRMGKG
jgi:hypothetical protein